MQMPEERLGNIFRTKNQNLIIQLVPTPQAQQITHLLTTISQFMGSQAPETRNKATNKDDGKGQITKKVNYIEGAYALSGEVLIALI